MKILITGASGMLGHKLASEYASKYDVYVSQYGASVNIPGCQNLFFDITLPLAADLSPAIIIHTAALTEVDFCEKQPRLAWDVNVKGTYHLLKAFPNAKFIYISTDFVFDGTIGNYKETDLPRPLNVYAQTKYAAEALLPQDSLIVRTSIFGHNLPGTKLSLPEKILAQLQQGEQIFLFDDLYSSPIYTGNLAQLIEAAIELDLSGIWNITGSERVSKYDLGCQIADVFQLEKGLILPKSSLEHKFNATRPRDVSLNTSMIREKLGYATPTLQQSLQAFKEDYALEN